MVEENLVEFRSSHRACSVKKAALKYFVIFTGKYLWWSVLLIKAWNVIKKRLQHRCFPVNIAKLLRTPILKNICERLLLLPEKIYIFPMYEFKGTVMQIEKALMDDCLHVSKLSWKFRIPTNYNFAVIFPWNELFS